MGNMKFFLQVISFHFQVIYCYGDLVPRHGELFEGKEESGNRWINIYQLLGESSSMKITITINIDRSHQVDNDQSSCVGC